MRKFSLIATVVVLLASVACVSKTQAQSPYAVTKDSRWTVEFGAKAYDRLGSELGLPLITDGITNDTLFDSEQASELGSTVGAEIKFGYVSKSGREFEIRTIIADWDQSHEVTGANLESPFFTTPGSEPTTVNYDYDSDYFSIEVMQRRALSPGITFMFGPRFISTKDKVEFAGSLQVSPGGGAPFLFTQTETTEATNALIGLQAGLEFNVPVTQDIYVNSFIRTGGYMNPTEVITSVRNNVSGLVGAEQRQTKSTGSFLAEVGGRLYVDIVPNAMSTYVGYEATWIDGLAVAPDQILNTSGGIETANTPFFHAVTFGLNFSY
ncbi:MAG: hypothetical protein ACI87E_004030 [Mariniblastus sp.]